MIIVVLGCHDTRKKSEITLRILGFVQTDLYSRKDDKVFFLAHNMVIGLSKIVQHEPEVLFCDLFVSADMHCFEFVKAVKNSPLYANAYEKMVVVVVPGKVGDVGYARNKARECGFLFISDPGDKEEVERVLNEIKF